MEDPALLKVIRKNESVLIRLPQSGHVVSFLASATYDTRDAASITAAEVSGRKQAREYLKSYENCPAMKRCPNFGTRESRYVNASYELTEVDIMSDRHFDDVIALGA
ncbi:hypothetical protein N7499_011772 [Penicillium canescens]|nr:hypothetical protein N7499_011772 [Penicillium canescens]KAJ6182064.1 hypothetical protein N7485_000706 [Penicillium canescens]